MKSFFGSAIFKNKGIPGTSTPVSTKISPILFLVICILSLTNVVMTHHSLSTAICYNLEEQYHGILSEDVYNDLAQNIDWDLGQKTLRGELAEENLKIMKCIFNGGFNLENLLECIGDNYEKVIQAYHTELEKTRTKFEDSIINALKSKGYDKIASNSFEKFEISLKEALQENSNPEMALNLFEKEVLGIVPADMEHLEVLKKKTHGHYLVYLSFKRLIKAYILMTIACLQQFLDKAELPMPVEFNYRLFSEKELDDMFPEDEISKIYTHKTVVKENHSTEEGSGKTFNEEMVRQARFKNILAINLATGKLEPTDFDHSKMPEDIYKGVIRRQMLEDLSSNTLL